MSHHGSGPFDDKPDPNQRKLINELLNSSKDFRGAIGDFPEGKLNSTDEGAIQFAVTNNKGKVILDFGTPVAWLGLNPQQAADVAMLLLKQAREASRVTGQPITFIIG